MGIMAGGVKISPSEWSTIGKKNEICHLKALGKETTLAHSR
jgi:hypothetical protein